MGHYVFAVLFIVFLITTAFSWLRLCKKVWKGEPGAVLWIAAYLFSVMLACMCCACAWPNGIFS